MARRIPHNERPRQGSIVYSGVFDSLGNNYKDRTVLLLRVNDDEDTFDGIAITTKTDKAPADHQVKLEHDHPLTGLTDPCVAVCTWPCSIERQRIRRVVGRLPKANLQLVFEKIRLLQAQGVLPGTQVTVPGQPNPPES